MERVDGLPRAPRDHGLRPAERGRAPRARFRVTHAPAVARILYIMSVESGGGAPGSVERTVRSCRYCRPPRLEMLVVWVRRPSPPWPDMAGARCGRSRGGEVGRE